MFVCLGGDGHVDIGGGDEDCCHDASALPADGGHSVALNGPDDCCVDVVIPTIDAQATAGPVRDESSAGRFVARDIVALPLTILDVTLCDFAPAAPPGLVAPPPPRVVRTVVLLL